MQEEEGGRFEEVTKSRKELSDGEERHEDESKRNEGKRNGPQSRINMHITGLTGLIFLPPTEHDKSTKRENGKEENIK